MWSADHRPPNAQGVEVETEGAWRLYCPRCGWETPEAEQACKPECPDCRGRLHVRDTIERVTGSSTTIRVNGRWQQLMYGLLLVVPPGHHVRFQNLGNDIEVVERNRDRKTEGTST